MRIWDIHPRYLCRKHLLGEHRELHGLWNIITKHGCVGGYAHHPETKRWIGKEGALYKRHELLVKEMKKRGYNHNSPLDFDLVKNDVVQDVFINTIAEQKELLKKKKCDCRV
ncbi:MAG: pyrimidine dimer DNA glycosylase [Candidatus Moraniibacteriota bacterium]|nr:MAG: pyrimidine dimer DNA glycosylase [Candidatus Moranbacteria bacterium]